MFLLIVGQEVLAYTRWNLDGQNCLHESCNCSKSFNDWARASFGPGVAELDGNNHTFSLTRPREENYALDRVKSILSEQRNFRYRALVKPPSFFEEVGSMLELGSVRARSSERKILSNVCSAGAGRMRISV